MFKKWKSFNLEEIIAKFMGYIKLNVRNHFPILKKKKSEIIIHEIEFTPTTSQLPQHQLHNPIHGKEFN